MKESELSVLQIHLWQLQKQRYKQELTILLYVHVYTHTMTPTPEHQSCPATVPGWKFLFRASDMRPECTAELLGTTYSAPVWSYEAEHVDLTACLT